MVQVVEPVKKIRKHGGGRQLGIGWKIISENFGADLRPSDDETNIWGGITPKKLAENVNTTMVRAKRLEVPCMGRNDLIRWYYDELRKMPLNAHGILMCPLAGMPIVPNTYGNMNTVGGLTVDRHPDPSKGYVEGNIRLISWYANLALGDQKANVLKALAKNLQD